MSNTTVPISEWCKEIRVALARKEMNLQSVADEIGYSYTTITALISGRIVKDNYLDIAKKINEVLEVNVLPEKPQLPSDEWCGAVRAKLYVKKMNISELSCFLASGEFYRWICREPYRTIRRRMTKKEMEPTAITSRIQFRNWKRKIRSR